MAITTNPQFAARQKPICCSVACGSAEAKHGVFDVATGKHCWNAQTIDSEPNSAIQRFSCIAVKSSKMALVSSSATCAEFYVHVVTGMAHKVNNCCTWGYSVIGQRQLICAPIAFVPWDSQLICHWITVWRWHSHTNCNFTFRNRILLSVWYWKYLSITF